MSNTILKVTFCIASLLLITTVAYSQQPKQNTDIEYIEEKMKRISDLERDFLDFVKSRIRDSNVLDVASELRDSNERHIASELHDISDMVYQGLHSNWGLAWVYHNMSCKSDKAVARRTFKLHLKYFTERLELLVSLANSQISYTQAPATAASGTQLKNEMREIKARLETINSKLQD